MNKKAFIHAYLHMNKCIHKVTFIFTYIRVCKY